METSLKIFMLGARRCGKSSTLASMLSSLDSLDNNICVSFPDETTKEYLRQKQTEMKQIFSDENIGCGYWIDDGSSGDAYVNTYSMDIKIHEKLLIHVHCTDIPGEIIQDDMNTLLEVSADSDVIIVAIDTPQLMENKRNGIQANFVDYITDLCQLLISQKGMKHKRIILVPLKCEKYVHEGRMNEVAEKVKNVYANLTYQWSKNGQSECYIIPVQTLGDLEFDHFDHIKNEQTRGRRVDIAYYTYSGNKNYSPRLCEQPILFAIDYAINKVCWESHTQWYHKAAKGATSLLKTIFSQ